jgi:hypothetical protein
MIDRSKFRKTTRLTKGVYIAINVVNQLLVFFILIFANTYINDKAGPNGLLWQDNHLRMGMAIMVGFAAIKTLILILEGGLILLLMYYLNRSVLKDEKKCKARPTNKCNYYDLLYRNPYLGFFPGISLVDKSPTIRN